MNEYTAIYIKKYVESIRNNFHLKNHREGRKKGRQDEIVQVLF